MDTEYDIEFYKRFRRFVKAYMQVVYNIEVTGLENIPNDKTYLLAGNHLNILDSWLLITCIDDNLRFMVDKKLYRYKSWEHFFKSVGTFEIDPNKSDVNAVRTAVKLLKANENVVIFPEGKTHKIKEIVPFKDGVARIAKIASASLIPFGINGSYIPGSKLNINFGEAIDLNKYNKNEYDEILETTVRKLEKKH